MSKILSLFFNGIQGIKQLFLEGKILACFRCKNTYIEVYLNTLIPDDLTSGINPRLCPPDPQGMSKILPQLNDRGNTI